MWHMTGSLVKAKRTEPKFELLPTIHCQGDRLLHLSSAKKIDYLREKGKKILEKQQNPDFLHDIIHNIHDQCQVIQCTQKQENMTHS